MWESLVPGRKNFWKIGLLLLISACGGGNFGATPGGVQDMRLARALIEQGIVPPPDAFLVEGMFSEHDLGIPGASCERPLCLRGAMGIAPDNKGEVSSWIQVALSSGIDPDTFVRPSLTLIAVVDVSGSMGWNYGEESPGELARQILTRMVPHLEARDRIALVTYGSTVKTRLGLTPGDKHEKILRKINGLGAGGSTNMEAGLRRAYKIARNAPNDTDEKRIILFTDVQPNVGATSASEFQQIVEEGARDGIGITILGLGEGLGPEVFNAMSHLRGGNAFSLFTSEDVERLMTEEWPFMVSPIAYDLHLDLAPEAGFTVAESYGFPGSDGAPGSSLDVSTVFLSRRRGALLVRLAPEQQAPIASLQSLSRLSYQTLDGEIIEEDLEILYHGEALDARGQFFQEPVVGKTVALALLVSGMKEAATLYSTNRELAIDTMQRVFERFSSDAEALGDPALTPEVALAERMLVLMQEGAPQGSLYGGF